MNDDLIPYAGGRYYFNAGQTRRQGFELGAELATAAGITLRGSATFSDNTLTQLRRRLDVLRRARVRRPTTPGNEYPGVPPAFYQVALGWAPAQLRYVRFEVAYEGSDSYYADAANTDHRARLWRVQRHRRRARHRCRSAAGSGSGASSP